MDYTLVPACKNILQTLLHSHFYRDFCNRDPCQYPLNSRLTSWLKLIFSMGLGSRHIWPELIGNLHLWSQIALIVPNGLPPRSCRIIFFICGVHIKLPKQYLTIAHHIFVSNNHHPNANVDTIIHTLKLTKYPVNTAANTHYPSKQYLALNQELWSEV